MRIKDFTVSSTSFTISLQQNDTIEVSIPHSDLPVQHFKRNFV